MIINYLAEPHIHECVPGLANFSHVQLPCPWCHQSWGHAPWVGCVQASQLLHGRNMPEDRSIILFARNLLQLGEKACEKICLAHMTRLSPLVIIPVKVLDGSNTMLLN